MESRNVARNTFKIRNITANLTNIYNRLFLAGEQITAEKIRNEHLGRTHSDHTLLAIFREHNDREQKLFDVGRRAKSTFNRYLLTYRRLEEYLKTEYHLTDIAMNELNYDFIYGFSTLRDWHSVMLRNYRSLK